MAVRRWRISKRRRKRETMWLRLTWTQRTQPWSRTRLLLPILRSPRKQHQRLQPYRYHLQMDRQQLRRSRIRLYLPSHLNHGYKAYRSTLPSPPQHQLCRHTHQAHPLLTARHTRHHSSHQSTLLTHHNRKHTTASLQDSTNSPCNPNHLLKYLNHLPPPSSANKRDAPY